MTTRWRLTCLLRMMVFLLTFILVAALTFLVVYLVELARVG